MENKKNIILKVKGLKKYFPLNKDIFGRPTAHLRAVDDVSFTLEAGKTIGVVGESGCGKTTLGRTILQLYDTTGGRSLYYGHKIEDFLPKYYLNELKNITSYNRKFNILFNYLTENLGIDFNASVVTIDSLKQSLTDTEAELKLINKVNDSVKYKSLLKSIAVLNNVLELLDNASYISGGAILINNSSLSNLLVNEIILKNKISKLNNQKIKLSYDQVIDDLTLERVEKDITSLTNELEKIENEINEIKKSMINNKLFNELEENKEYGLDLARLTKKELRSLRREIQLIFQDPYSSLPPRMTIGSILTEPVKVHKIVEKEKISEHVRKIMKMCGLQPQYYDRYPHEFSGGQRQRICIARALVVNPRLVICDEPVSALDVSIQAQIINLLKDLQNRLGLTYMFISHDLSVVKYITDSIIVMYLGNMMEIGDTNDIFDNPLHPYTKALFSAVPVPDPDAKMNRIILKGDIPSPANPPKGCKFHTRCEKCMNVCKFKTPNFIEYSENHLVACHLYDAEVMSNLQKYDQEYLEYEEKCKNELDQKQKK